MEAWKEELYHHGILGQKWGKKNGPPYPLSSSDHSASEKKAGWRKSLSKKNLGMEPKSIRIKRNKVLKKGAAVAGAVMIAAGTYYLYKTGKFERFVEIGRSSVDNPTFGGITVSEEVKKHFGTLSSGESSFSNSLSKVGSANTHNHDCVPGSIALCESVNNGLSLKAKDISTGMSWTDIKKVYPTVQEKQLSLCKNANDIKSLILEHQKDGDNGLLALVANNSQSHQNHVICWAVENSSVVVRDQQFELQRSDGTMLKGLEINLDGSRVSIGGILISGDRVKTFVDQYFGMYNLSVSKYAQLNGVPITNDIDILDQFFEKR